MTVVTNESQQINIFAREPKMYIDPNHEENSMGFNERNEILNGRICMAAFPVMIVVYALTGQILPGIW